VTSSHNSLVSQSAPGVDKNIIISPKIQAIHYTSICVMSLKVAGIARVSRTRKSSTQLIWRIT
jgi:hypothetical protein